MSEENGAASAPVAARATRYASLSPAAARLLLLAFAALCAWGIVSGGGHVEASARDGRDIDIGLYQAVAERVHAGEAYYDVAGSELRARHFATRPFWNWRLPTLAWLTARLPQPDHARLLLGVSALSALLLWVPLLRAHRSLAAALAGGLLMLAGLLACASEQGFLFHEMWAGVWIAISLAAWGLGRRGLAWLAALFALFVRELALPYLVVMMCAAWFERDRREAARWLAGIALFALALGAHAFVVSGRLGADELVNESWLQLGGWSFVLATARWNALLLLAPTWVVALAVPCALLGLAGWRSPLGARAALTVGAYATAYLVAGRPDNTYWGLVYAPLLPLGLVFAPAALWQLAQRAAGHNASAEASSSPT